MRSSRRWRARCSALLLFLRFDAVVAVGAVIAGAGARVCRRASGCGGRSGRRSRPACALWLWYLLGPMREYCELPLVFISHLPCVAVRGLRRWRRPGCCALVVVGAPLAARSRSASSDVFPTALAVAVVALAVYAFVFRQPGGKLTDYDAYALRNVRQLLFHACPRSSRRVVGYALVARGLFWRDPAFILTLTAFSLFFFYKIRIVPEHFWAARRFVPVILPGALLLVAAAALTGVRGRLLFSRAIRGPIGIVFIALLARAVRARGEAGRGSRRVRRASSRGSRSSPAQIGDDDLLIVESRDAGSDVHVLGAAAGLHLRAQRARALERRARQGDVRGVPRGRRARNTAACCFSAAAAPTCCRRAGASRRSRATASRCRSTSRRRTRIRARVKQKEFDYSVYAFGPPAAPTGPNELDVGINDDLNVIRFHAKELTEGRTFRWSQDAVVRHRQPDRRAAIATLALVDERRRPSGRRRPRRTSRCSIGGARARHRARRRRIQGIRRSRFPPTWRPRRRRPASRSASR